MRRPDLAIDGAHTRADVREELYARWDAQDRLDDHTPAADVRESAVATYALAVLEHQQSKGTVRR